MLPRAPLPSHMKRLFSAIAATLLFLSPVDAATVSLQGNRVLIDGELVDVYGIRTASALVSDRTTDHLIGQLDEYKSYGVNAVTVFYMGSSGGHYDPFTPDGEDWLHPEFRDRMDRIIEACDERGMIVIAGIFYQWKNIEISPRSLRDWDAARNAVATVARHLRKKGYRNVMLNIANEQNSGVYVDEPWGRVRNVEDLLELVRIAKREHPELIVGAGGYDHDKNLQIGLADEVDVLMFDTLGPDRQEHSGYWHDHFVSNGVDNKPLINVEVFGAWTGQFMPPGVYTSEGRALHYKDIADAAERPGLSVFFHSNVWCQGPSIGEPMRYDLGGFGTELNRGIRWWFQRVLDTIEGKPANNPPRVVFTNLEDGAILKAPANIEVTVDAQDDEDEIVSLSLFVNFELVAVISEPPYIWKPDMSVRARRRLGNQPAQDYNLLAVARDSRGETGDVSITIKVAEGEIPQPLIRTNTTSGQSPLTIRFDASESRDPDGQIVRYDWTFGDGSRASGPVVEHTYQSSDAANFTATLIIFDNDGNRVSDKIRVSIK